jgi:hypothetical protein
VDTFFFIRTLGGNVIALYHRGLSRPSEALLLEPFCIKYCVESKVLVYNGKLYRCFPENMSDQTSCAMQPFQHRGPFIIRSTGTAFTVNLNQITQTFREQIYMAISRTFSSTFFPFTTARRYVVTHDSSYAVIMVRQDYSSGLLSLYAQHHRIDPNSLMVLEFGCSNFCTTQTYCRVPVELIVWISGISYYRSMALKLLWRQDQKKALEKARKAKVKAKEVRHRFRYQTSYHRTCIQ